MNETLPAETLTAMTGIFPTRAPSEIEVRGSVNYLARCRRRITKFLDATEPQDIRWQRPPSQESLWEKIATPLDPAQFSEWATEADLDLATGVNWPAVIQASHDHLRSLWPVYEDTSLGLHTHELSFDELLDVWHITRTLNDPETLFDDLDSMLLLPEQVVAIRTVYPALYESIRALTMAALKPYIEVEGAVEKTKSLPAERETQIRILLGVEDEDRFEVSETPEQKPPEPKRDTASESKAPEEQRTPSEVATRKRIASK